MGAGWGRGAAPRRKQIVASGSGRSGLLLMRKTLASFQLVALPSSNLAHNQDKRWLIIKYLVGFPWPVAVIDCPPVICITSRDFGFGYSDLVSDSVDYCVSLGTWPTFLLIRVDSLHNVINWILGTCLPENLDWPQLGCLLFHVYLVTWSPVGQLAAVKVSAFHVTWFLHLQTGGFVRLHTKSYFNEHMFRALIEWRFIRKYDFLFHQSLISRKEPLSYCE